MAPDSSALIARLGDVSQWDLEVIETLDVTRSMRRIRCTAPGLGELSYQPGQDLMLSVPTAGDGDTTFRRRYTIRSFDPSVPAVDLDAHRARKPAADRVLALAEDDEQRAVERLVVAHLEAISRRDPAARQVPQHLRVGVRDPHEDTRVPRRQSLHAAG